MFTLEHFIWLGISTVIFTAMLVIYKRFNLSFEMILNIMLTVSVLSEVTKILCNLQPAPHADGGMILDPGDLPLHLCSIQIFLMFILKYFIKTEAGKEKMLGFMCPSMIIGAVMALLIPTVGVGIDVVQVYQYLIFHTFHIYFAVYTLKEKLVNWTPGVYVRNIGYLGGLALLCTWFNSALSGVLPRVNFMYLVRPPMKNLPILNLNNGWGVYFITLASLALGLMGVFHITVTLITNKAKKKENNAKA